jgi:ribosomal protein S18 acetylase RimI-like enzyme
MSASARLPTRFEIDEIVSSQATVLLLAYDDGSGSEAHVDGGDEPSAPIVGMLTLVMFRLPTGVRAWIEDVVVDTRRRGQGIGEALTQAAIELAVAGGARTVDLTSRPSREAANRLYQRMGFEQRDTNVYRFRFPS